MYIIITGLLVAFARSKLAFRAQDSLGLFLLLGVGGAGVASGALGALRPDEAFGVISFLVAAGGAAALLYGQYALSAGPAPRKRPRRRPY